MVWKPLAVQFCDDVVTVRILADGTDNEAFVPEARGVVGKISRSAAQSFSIPELVS